MDSYFTPPSWKSLAGIIAVALLMVLLSGCSVFRKAHRTTDITELRKEFISKIDSMETHLQMNEFNTSHIDEDINIEYYKVDSNSLNKDPPIYKKVVIHRKSAGESKRELKSDATQIRHADTSINDSISYYQAVEKETKASPGIKLEIVAITLMILVFIVVYFRLK